MDIRFYAGNNRYIKSLLQPRDILYYDYLKTRCPFTASKMYLFESYSYNNVTRTIIHLVGDYRYLLFTTTCFTENNIITLSMFIIHLALI